MHWEKDRNGGSETRAVGSRVSDAWVARRAVVRARGREGARRRDFPVIGANEGGYVRRSAIVACALGKRSGMLVAKEILPNEVNFSYM